jgi:hypothetical protein
MNKTGLFAVVALLLGGASIGLGFYAGQTNASSTATADPEVVSAAPAADTSEIEGNRQKLPAEESGDHA